MEPEIVDAERLERAAAKLDRDADLAAVRWPSYARRLRSRADAKWANAARIREAVAMRPNRLAWDAHVAAGGD